MAQTQDTDEFTPPSEADGDRDAEATSGEPFGVNVPPSYDQDGASQASPAADAPRDGLSPSGAAGDPVPSVPVLVEPVPLDEASLPRAGFLQKKWVQEALPFATSLALHAGLIAVGLLLIKPVSRLITRPTNKDQIVIPDSVVITGADIGGVANPGLGQDPNRQASQERDMTASLVDKGWASAKNSNLSQALAPQGGETADSTIARGVGGLGARDANGSVFSGSDAGGGKAMFGSAGGGGGLGAKSKIFGHSSGVRSIAYVCDASGSMLLKIEPLKQELEKSVGNLQPIQAFDVVFFREPDRDRPRPYYTLSDRMLMGTPDNKKNLYTFLDDIRPRGATLCIPSLEYAFNLNPKPQLIYLLTDGEFEDEGSQKVMDAIARLNLDHKVHINTILLTGTREELDHFKSVKAAMQKIADDNGGVAVAISIDDL